MDDDVGCFGPLSMYNGEEREKEMAGSQPNFMFPSC